MAPWSIPCAWPFGYWEAKDEIDDLDGLGVIYTPNEIVRFMIESADYLCEKHFGCNLIDKDVKILDPAAGTGTFGAVAICQLQSSFIPRKLPFKSSDSLFFYKYRSNNGWRQKNAHFYHVECLVLKSYRGAVDCHPSRNLDQYFPLYPNLHNKISSTHWVAILR